MNTTSQQYTQIHREQRNISKYSGLLCGRLFLMACLLLLSFFLLPVTMYFFIFLLLFPWAFSNILSSHKHDEPNILLASCADRYFYTPARMTIEKFTGRFTILLLILWQLQIIQSERTDLFVLAPSVCLFTYLLSRILGTLFIRSKIHQFYLNLDSINI